MTITRRAALPSGATALVEAFHLQGHETEGEQRFLLGEAAVTVAGDWEVDVPEGGALP